jgi:hypothetical protein
VLPKAEIERHLARVRAVCKPFPEVVVRPGQHHAFLVRGKTFAYFLVDHHGDGRVAIQCKAEKGLNATLVDNDPERFFLPPYMAHHGWIGVHVDVAHVDWAEIEDLLTEAYRLVAPKSLARQV